MDLNGDEIRQGFLCPFCMKDLCDYETLAKHVDDLHGEGKAGENDAIVIVKDAFGRAKQKIMNIDFLLNQPGSSGIQEEPRKRLPVYEEQQIGKSRSLRYMFVEERAKHVNSVVVGTNNLIMRLDKLINDCPGADVSRKEFERTTVPWEADSVGACQSCSAKFNIARRRHHCRLCGSILCHNCSLFLPILLARRLVDPAFSENSIDVFGDDTKLKRFPLTDNDSIQIVKNKTGKLFSTLGFDVNFGNQTDDTESTLRVCGKCKKLLQRRREAMDQLQTPSIFKDMYDKLCQLLIEASNLSPSYKRMVASLRNGESLYTLEASIKLRKKLAALQHEIQSLIERIEKWGLNDDPMADRPTPREFILRANIRVNCLVSLKESFNDLAEPPTVDEYKKLQIRHRERFQRSDSYSTNSLGGDHNKGKQGMKTSASFSGFKANDGWTPEPDSDMSKNPFLVDDDLHPMQQQYLITKSYLKQAAQSGRLEEIEMLEKNVYDIEEELGRLNLNVP